MSDPGNKKPKHKIDIFGAIILLGGIILAVLKSTLQINVPQAFIMVMIVFGFSMIGLRLAVKHGSKDVNNAIAESVPLTPEENHIKLVGILTAQMQTESCAEIYMLQNYATLFLLAQDVQNVSALLLGEAPISNIENSNNFYDFVVKIHDCSDYTGLTDLPTFEQTAPCIGSIFATKLIEFLAQSYTKKLTYIGYAPQENAQACGDQFKELLNKQLTIKSQAELFYYLYHNKMLCGQDLLTAHSNFLSVYNQTELPSPIITEIAEITQIEPQVIAITPIKENPPTTIRPKKINR